MSNKATDTPVLPEELRAAAKTNDTAWHKHLLNLAAERIEQYDGFKDAFYEITEILGLPAMSISPKEAFETLVIPKLRLLTAVRQASAFRRGDVVLLELMKEIGNEHFVAIANALKMNSDITGVKFVLLPAYVRPVDRKKS